MSQKVEEVIEYFGHIDIVIQNAGISAFDGEGYRFSGISRFDGN
jgi:NAD(P)-dependent dehydrogenase (short-subunit alcohol dehydrogenase family)